MTKDEALAFDLALEALLDSIDDVRDCLNQSLPHAGYARYDRRIEAYRMQLAKHEEAITALKKVRALDKMAENARELGLDYEPAEVLGHNGWGFPIKAAAPVQKKCDCAAHSAADCVCGAWDKSAVAPVREDWGPGPHECHSLTASVQEPVAWRYRGIFHEFDPSDWAEGPVTPLYTTPPAAQRQWVGLTDEEITALKRNGERYISSQDFARAIEAKLRSKNNG